MSSRQIEKIDSRGLLFSFEDPYLTNVYVIIDNEQVFVLDTSLGSEPLRYMQVYLYHSLSKLPPADGTIVVQNPRFPEFQFEIRRAKKGQFGFRGSGVRYAAKVR